MATGDPIDDEELIAWTVVLLGVFFVLLLVGVVGLVWWIW
jgi:hypothetical protein